VTIMWCAIELFEVRVSAWNGRFGGTADIYISVGSLG